MSIQPIALRASHARQVRAGVAVEWLTIVWMVIEAAVSLSAGIAAGSIALVAFGVDSLIELVSAGVLLWRLILERRDPAVDPERVERAERTASRVVGWSLLVLAAYVVLHSVYNLWTKAIPDSSVAGVALAAAALVVMPLLVRAKLRVAASINSVALKGDAMCGVVCAYMAATLLVGLGLRAVFGWWWADPVAALGLVYFIVREGREALTAQCGCACD
ncbi:MAG TPA: cation transporter [bacterium]|nr:cation transporter [bacterium]